MLPKERRKMYNIFVQVYFDTYLVINRVDHWYFLKTKYLDVRIKMYKKMNKPRFSVKLFITTELSA